MAKCKKCGGEVPGGDGVCPLCGTAAYAQVSPSVKEECEKYRLPTIAGGFIMGIFILVGMCILKYPIKVFLHGTEVQVDTVHYSMLDLVLNGWGTLITVLFVIMAVFAVASFVFYGIGLVSMFMGIFITSFAGNGTVTIGIHDMVMDNAAMGFITPSFIIFAGGLVISFVVELFFTKYSAQYGKSSILPKGAAIKSLWIRRGLNRGVAPLTKRFPRRTGGAEGGI